MEVLAHRITSPRHVPEKLNHVFFGYPRVPFQVSPSFTNTLEHLVFESTNFKFDFLPDRVHVMYYRYRDAGACTSHKSRLVVLYLGWQV